MRWDSLNQIWFPKQWPKNWLGVEPGGGSFRWFIWHKPTTDFASVVLVPCIHQGHHVNLCQLYIRFTSCNLLSEEKAITTFCPSCYRCSEADKRSQILLPWCLAPCAPSARKWHSPSKECWWGSNNLPQDLHHSPHSISGTFPDMPIICHCSRYHMTSPNPIFEPCRSLGTLNTWGLFLLHQLDCACLMLHQLVIAIEPDLQYISITYSPYSHIMPYSSTSSTDSTDWKVTLGAMAWTLYSYRCSSNSCKSPQFSMQASAVSITSSSSWGCSQTSRLRECRCRAKELLDWVCPCCILPPDAQSVNRQVLTICPAGLSPKSALLRSDPIVDLLSSTSSSPLRHSGYATKPLQSTTPYNLRDITTYLPVPRQRFGNKNYNQLLRGTRHDPKSALGEV